MLSSYEATLEHDVPDVAIAVGAIVKDKELGVSELLPFGAVDENRMYAPPTVTNTKQTTMRRTLATVLTAALSSNISIINSCWQGFHPHASHKNHVDESSMRRELQ